MHYCVGSERHAWTDPDDAAKCCNGFERAHRVERDGDGQAVLVYFWRPVAAAPRSTPPDSEALSLVPATPPPPRKRRQALRQTDDAAATSEAPRRETTELLHIPFFERLSALEQDSAPWQAVSAGLLALRLVDRWGSRHGVAGRKPLFKEFVAVRRAVEAVEADQIRAILGDVINAVSEFATRETQPLVPVLVAYGAVLEAQSEWALAGDAYATAIEHARTRDARRRLADCYARMGRCKRKSGDDAAAAAIYRRGRRAAEAIGDSAGVLQIQAHEARIKIDGGALAEAATMLDAVIAGARLHHVDDVLAVALHDRGTVAYKRSQSEDAVLFYFEALEAYGERPDRLRALHDLALQLSEMGVRTAARHAFETVLLSTEQHDLHGAAAVNLLDLAALDENPALFDAYRDVLESMSLPPALESLFYIILGDGHRRFQRPAMAEWAYHVAEKIAIGHALNENAERAAAALTALDEMPERISQETPILPDSTRRVIEAVRAMREQVAEPNGHLLVSAAL